MDPEKDSLSSPKVDATPTSKLDPDSKDGKSGKVENEDEIDKQTYSVDDILSKVPDHEDEAITLDGSDEVNKEDSNNHYAGLIEQGLENSFPYIEEDSSDSEGESDTEELKQVRREEKAKDLVKEFSLARPSTPLKCSSSPMATASPSAQRTLRSALC